MQVHTHTRPDRVCQWAAPVNAWQSDIHRLVNPVSWQDFTQTAERKKKVWQNQAHRQKDIRGGDAGQGTEMKGGGGGSASWRMELRQ